MVEVAQYMTKRAIHKLTDALPKYEAPATPDPRVFVFFMPKEMALVACGKFILVIKLWLYDNNSRELPRRLLRKAHMRKRQQAYEKQYL